MEQNEKIKVLVLSILEQCETQGLSLEEVMLLPKELSKQITISISNQRKEIPFKAIIHRV